MGNIILSAGSCLCACFSLFQSIFLADGHFKHGLSAEGAVRMGTADRRCREWLEENPCSFSLALLSAPVRSLGPAEGAQAREHGFAWVTRACQRVTGAYTPEKLKPKLSPAKSKGHFKEVDICYYKDAFC